MKNARMVIEGELRVLRHFKNLAETAVMYARLLKERLSAVIAAIGSAEATTLDLDTRLPKPPGSTKRHQQEALYCKKVVLRLFKAVMAEILREHRTKHGPI